MSRTIPRTEDPDWVDSFFDGEEREDDWPFAQRIANVEAGDFLYLIYKDEVVGRFEITEVTRPAQTETILVGTDKHPIEARTIVWVRYPGERAPRTIQRSGHRGHRYYNSSSW